MNRLTPSSRAQSRRICVPRTLVVMNSFAEAMLRSTWDSAAKLTTTSVFSLIASSTAGRSLISPRTNLCLCESNPQMLLTLAAYVSASKLMTVHSDSSLRASEINAEPINPAPPVTKIWAFEKFIARRNWVAIKTSTNHFLRQVSSKPKPKCPC